MMKNAPMTKSDEFIKTGKFNARKALNNVVAAKKQSITKDVNVQIERLMVPVEKKTEVAFLTSYPPRECGIATYSKDLLEALIAKFGTCISTSVYPLETAESNNEYPKSVRIPLNTDAKVDFLKTAYDINSRKTIGLVVIQHEFGLFSSNALAFQEFLEYLDKPVVITFHTVLPNPNNEMREQVIAIGNSVQAITVMTQGSAKILSEQYGIDRSKISVIAHGTHLVEYSNRNSLKSRYGLEGRFVLSTFGLLGPGKSIETTLCALPAVVKLHPEVIFCIIGKSHPTLVKEQGEVYRDFLKSKIAELNLQDHVKFVDEFVPTSTLLEYLQLTDIYLFTSKDPNQAVSGTFVYALSSGCPVISTPIPHAREILKNGAGTTFDFEASDQLSKKILELLNDDNLRDTMRINGLHTTAASSWENMAIAHANLFDQVSERNTPLKFKKPEIDFKHIRKMTDHVGIIQFSKINQPDIESGYTLDDNARALIATCQHYQLTGDSEDLPYLKTYFDFVFCCFRHDRTFLNYVDKAYRFTDQNDTVNLEDACGRAIWALGYLLSMADCLPEKYAYIADKAKFVLEQSTLAMKEAKSPRAIAFIIKGLYFYNHYEDRDCVNLKIKMFADRLVTSFEAESEADWQWFESYLTYGNSVMPQALLMAYVMTLDKRYRKTARKSFDFLLSKIMVDGTIRVISNKNWYKKGDTFKRDFIGGEQPIDVAYTILALKMFHSIFPNAGYESLMEDSFAWFLGNNPLTTDLIQPLYWRLF